jgi:RHS repeat-associated protein
VEVKVMALRAMRALCAACVLAVSAPSFAAGGLVGAYPFEEGSGTSTADFSGLANTGTLNAATWTTAGKIGKALVFGGAHLGNVDLGNPAALNLSGSMTVSAWIYSTAFPGDDAAIVSKVDASIPGGFQLDATPDTGSRTVGFKLFNPNGTLMMRYGATVLQLNQWYYVAGVYDAAAQTMTVYLNGAPDNGTLVGTVASSQSTSHRDVLIGARPDDPFDYNFNGTIDEVRIYNRALTQAEIQADMNASAGSTTGAQMKGYYILPDHLNTPKLIANSTGTTVWRWDQGEPFGNDVPNGDPNNAGTTFDFPLRFPGQYFDRETNLTYNTFRDYDPSVGRYVESDLIGLAAGTNTYLYAKGIPLRFSDPNGLITTPGAGTIGDLGGKATEGAVEKILEWFTHPDVAGQDAAAEICKITQGRQPYGGTVDLSCTDGCIARQKQFRWAWVPGWLQTCIDHCVDFFPKCNKSPRACLGNTSGGA